MDIALRESWIGRRNATEKVILKSAVVGDMMIGRRTARDHSESKSFMKDTRAGK
jgi:hypothetical protein